MMDKVISIEEYNLKRNQVEEFYKYKRKYEGKSKIILILGEYLMKRKLKIR
jgi:hypothetical protein